ncbi:hypothetical protein METP3_00139 [Methanosarcinales archaeon]|nr:hypothetical protein METP3_00139 [Methanosarcinales archaeon]
MTFEKIINIVILSCIIGSILTICLFLRKRFAAKFESIFKESFNNLDIDKRYLILFTLMLFPLAVYILKNLDKYILLYFYFLAGFVILGLFGFILTMNKAAILSGLIYPILYFNYWNTYTYNLIAALLAISLILLISNIMSWDILKLFFILLMIMDISLVFVTKDMVAFGNKILFLQIPILIHIPFGEGISIGLGDIFITGLLCLEFTREKEYSDNRSLKFVWIITALFFMILYLVKAYLPDQMYPATIFVGLSFICAIALSRCNL